MDSDHQELLLSEQERFAWHSFITASGKLVTELDRDLQARTGLLLAEYEVLANLRDAEEHTLRMNQLAEKCSLSPSGLTRRFDAMVKAGYVNRARCRRDRRGVNAVITDQGLKRLAEAEPHHLEAVGRCFIASIRPELIDTIAQQLSNVSANLENAMASAPPIMANGTTPAPTRTANNTGSLPAKPAVVLPNTAHAAPAEPTTSDVTDRRDDFVIFSSN